MIGVSVVVPFSFFIFLNICFSFVSFISFSACVDGCWCGKKEECGSYRIVLAYIGACVPWSEGDDLVVYA